MAMNPEQFLVAEAGRRPRTDYRFRWGSYFGWAVLSAGFYGAYGVFKLVERRREHIRRRLAFSSYLWHALAARADGLGRRAEVQEALDNLSRIHAQIEAYERRNVHDPRTLAIVRLVLTLMLAGGALAVGLTTSDDGYIVTATGSVGAVAMVLSLPGLLGVGAYVNGFLNDDFRFFDTWEVAFAQNVEWVLQRLGHPAAIPSRARKVPERSTGLLLLVTAATAGAAGVWWRRAVMLEGNTHFDEDDQMENAILRSLGLAAEAGQAPIVPPVAR